MFFLRKKPSDSPAPDRRGLIVSRWFYYLSSIPRLLSAVRPRPTVLALFLNLPVRRPLLIQLRNGGRYKVRSAMDVWIIKETCLDRDYQRHSVEIEDGWNVVDIGAGLGDFAAEVGRTRPRCTVAAYEPFPESFKLLRQNLRLNGVENVQAFPVAVGGREGQVALQMGSGVAVRHSTAQAGEDGLAVEATTLDRIVAELPGGRCDYLKIDCEGGEYDILFGASDETLRSIRHICLEYHDGVTAYSHKDLAQFLLEKGFLVTIFPNPAHQDIGLMYAGPAPDFR